VTLPPQAPSPRPVTWDDVIGNATAVEIKSVRHTKLGPSRRSLVGGELVAQGQVFEGELAVAVQEREEPKQVEQQSDHRAEMVAGSGSTDQLLGRRMGFWRWTALAGAAQNLPPTAGQQYYGLVKIDGAIEVMTVSLHDLKGDTRFRVSLSPE
jgi:hypothetical protein